MKKIKMWLGVGMAGINFMGHSAKYGLYIVFCTTIVKVVELNKFS